MDNADETEGMDFFFKRALRRMSDVKVDNKISKKLMKQLIDDAHYTMSEFGLNELDIAMVCQDVIEYYTRSAKIALLSMITREMLACCIEVEMEDDEQD